LIKSVLTAFPALLDDRFLQGESILLFVNGEFEYFRIIQSFIAGEILRQLEETHEVRRDGGNLI
jgi:hypothetical protein